MAAGARGQSPRGVLGDRAGTMRFDEAAVAAGLAEWDAEAP